MPRSGPLRVLADGQALGLPRAIGPLPVEVSRPVGPQCAPGQPSPGIFSTLEAPSQGLRSLSCLRRTFVLSDTALTSNVTTDSNRFIQPLARRSMNLLSFPGRIHRRPPRAGEKLSRAERHDEMTEMAPALPHARTFRDKMRRRSNFAGRSRCVDRNSNRVIGT